MGTDQPVQPEPAGTAALPTLAEVLALPSVVAGHPRVLTGGDSLERRIRWAHVSELTDIGSLLRGGELVLTTGIALPDAADALARYVADLSAAGVGGLMVELGRRFAHPPAALIDAAAAAGLPVITLAREVRFVEITEAIHTRIVDAQVLQLRRSELIHQRFTALTVEGAPVHAIVAAAATLCRGPVVLEDLAHRVIATSGVPEDARLLHQWELRSRRVRSAPATLEVEPGTVWTVVPVGARGQQWGRLVTVGAEEPADAALVLERGAAALAVNRLSERDEAAVQVRAHHEVLTQLVDRSYPSVTAIDTRARALGVPLLDRVLIGVAVTITAPAQGPDLGGRPLQQDEVERVLATAHGRLAALVDPTDGGGVRLLVSVPTERDPAELLLPFAHALHGEVDRALPGGVVTIGVGSAVRDLREAGRSLSEADHVVAAAPAVGRRKAYFELLDVRVRGLIHVLRNDPRLQHFVERELGPLLALPGARGRDLLRTLSAYLDAGRNKSRAAAALGISRPALYARLATISELLDADLDDVETGLSLHVAVLGRASLDGEDDPARQRSAPDLAVYTDKRRDSGPGVHPDVEVS